MEKITPRKFIDQMYSQFKNIETDKLSSVITGDVMMTLMEEYYTYRRMLENSEVDNSSDVYVWSKNSEVYYGIDSSGDYDEYH